MRVSRMACNIVKISFLIKMRLTAPVTAINIEFDRIILELV